MALGKKTGGGSRKGRPNKITAAIKDAILQAANNQDGGAVGYLTRQATENPVAFMGLLGRILPMEHANAEGDAFRITIARDDAGL